ncbi:MAG: hypothetical protein DRP85_06095 [Candidatus Makaraimicrobium thalassicum]|nr:MAG: hypothetical protein DRP85_06095 [Candidatus Omnitrophota bacterium]
MIPIARIKKDLLYNQNLKDVIDVLKLISASEFSRLSSIVPQEDKLQEQIMTCFSLLKSVSGDSPFLVEKKGRPEGFLLVCSDEGFLGEVNTYVVNTALSRGRKDSARFMVLGERGTDILEETGIECKSFPPVKNDIKMGDIREISGYVMDLYKKGRIGAFYVVYMKFMSFTRHQIEVARILPCDEILTYLREEAKGTPDVLIEPGLYPVMEYLVKLWMEDSIYKIFWSSKLSEWAMRVMQLEHSSDELSNITADLEFKHFKSIHALSDKVIREIFAAKALQK